jgi:hypothetical protein
MGVAIATAPTTKQARPKFGSLGRKPEVWFAVGAPGEEAVVGSRS